MRCRTKPNPLIFMHMPKAAGSSFEAILFRQYPRGRFARLTGAPQNLEEFANRSQAERDSFDVISGHLHYGVHELLSRPATYITMLREPVDRVISHYHFVLSRPEHYLHDKVVQGGITLQDYVTTRVTLEADNDHVRWLTPNGHAGVHWGQCTRAMLDDAKARLAEFGAVGLTERFNESLALFKLTFGWGDMRGERRNITADRPAREAVSPEVRACIAERNALDVELYEFAERLFTQRATALGKPLQREAEHLS